VSQSTVPPVSALLPGVLAETAAAIERRIQFAFPPAKFQLRFMPAKLSARVFAELYKGNAPLIGVGWNGLADMSDGREFVGISTWTVMIAVKTSGASGQVRYLGDGVGPGLLNFVPAMIACLHGLKIDRVGTIRVTKVSNAYADDWGDDVAIAMLDLTVGVTVPVCAAVTRPEDLGMLNEIAECWVFPAETGPTPEYQSDWVRPNVPVP
jgi:hypothetical protein